MKRTVLLVGVIGSLFYGVADAQSYKQFHDELFCQDRGLTAYQALADYHNGLTIDAALQRVDGYVCTDRIPEVCDAKRDMLRDTVRLSYKIGTNIGLDGMSPAQFLQFNDANQAQAVSTCMEVVRRRE